jgi:hypothetical protein
MPDTGLARRWNELTGGLGEVIERRQEKLVVAKSTVYLLSEEDFAYIAAPFDLPKLHLGASVQLLLGCLSGSTHWPS